MKKIISKNSQQLPAGIRNEFSLSRWSIILVLLLWLPMTVSATLTLPAIPSNSNLAKRFELSTELIFRVKAGETFLPSGALIAYINGEIRGAQTASVLFPPTGNNVYKVLVFNDKAIGDTIRFKYYDIFTEKIYDITEKIEFVPNQVPDYANPVILNAFCPPVDKVTGLVPENGKENLNATCDLFWQPSSNTTSYNLFLWEDGASVPTVPYQATITGTTFKLNNLKYGQLYRWKIGSVNDCSSAESAVQTFKVRQLPDLTVTDLQAPGNIQSGSNFTVTYKIKNIGLGNTAGNQWKDVIYISNDRTFSNEDKLLSANVNIKQLERDSLYTQSITVSLPNEYSGDYYFFVRSDYYSSVAELLEDNNQLISPNPTTVALKSLPDILVNDIQSEQLNINPGDSVTFNWKVENTGGVNATGGWAERISLVPVSGLKLTLSPNIEYKAALNAGSAVNRSVKIKIPDLPRFSGEANIEVELIPFPELEEHIANKANNKASSVNKVNIGEILSLQIQTTSVLESNASPVRCIITRSGNYTNDLTVTLSASVNGQLTIPSTVIIPANQSSVVFNLYTINNTVLEGTRDIDIIAGAASYSNTAKKITILDDEVSSLSAKISKTPATEGDTIRLTVTRDLVTNLPVMVSLATNKSSQWTFPSSVIIAANTASVEVSVIVTNDNIPELAGDAMIYASSAGITTSQVTVSIADNDVPQVSLELLTDTVSESAGVYATWGVIKRLKGDGSITVNLTSSHLNTLFFPAGITLPQGVPEQKFNIGVVDNIEVDGNRKPTITGSVFISSCNCGTSAENGGVVTADLVIVDNDGPSLSVSVNPVSLPEGKLNAGMLTVSRNTPTDQALNITISHNDTSEVSIPVTATIPAGQKSVQVPIGTKNDQIEDGNQMVSIQANAESFSSGYGYVFVSDQNKPDLVITNISLNSDTVATNDVIEIRGSASNVGFSNANAGVQVNFYFSKDKTFDSGDQLMGNYAFSDPIVKETSAEFVKTVNVPDEPGNFYILAKINPGEQITELVYFNNESNPAAFTIIPEYSVTAVSDSIRYMPNSTISIHGNALNSKNGLVPNADVDVYILTGGTRRQLKAKTNNLGEYTTQFVPNSNESGHYIIGACYPGQNLNTAQDNFDIPGIRLASGSTIIWEMKLGQTLTGKITVKNTSEAPLKQLVIVPDNLPAGCELKFDTITLMAGNQTMDFNFTLKATELTSGRDYEKINFRIKSSEGITTEFPAWYYCQALQGQLKANPVSINTTMTKGKSRLYELQIYNNGAGESGTVTISLPNVNWMTLVSPATLTNMAPQDTAIVILSLTPTADIPLNTPVSGNIAVNCVNGNGVLVPYRIEAVSEETGDLKVDVIDEYTYFTEDKPHVKNAHVVVRHPFSGQIMADGFTNENGIFAVTGLPEGSYKMMVEAEKHEGFQTTIIIDPGRVNEQSVFISFQAITYTWEVVPTQIEDKYDVQLVMKYETSVPVPVVLVEMPKVMPQLFNDETYPFLVTMTNKGLITAIDVQLTFPQDDPEYEFVTNFTMLDLLAQQSIQVPVVMKRRIPLKSAQLRTPSSGPCSNYSVTIYGWECGKDKRWGQSQNGFTFNGRVCEGTSTNTGPDGGPWGNGWFWPLVPNRAGNGSYWFDPDFNVPRIGSTTVGCEPCLISLALNGIGCFPILGPIITNGAGILGCIIGLGDMDVTLLDLADCGMTGVGLVVDLAEIGCAYGLARTAYDCYKDPPIFIKSASLKSGELPSRPLMPPILKQSLQDLVYDLSALESLDSLSTEIMGKWDWKSKISLKDFNRETDPFIKQNKPFTAEDIVMLEQKMSGTDITRDEIRLFTTRWNNTVNAWSHHVYSPTIEYPDIIDKLRMKLFIGKLVTAQNYAISRGYENIFDMYNQALATTKEQIEAGRSAVCASVSINITQKVVMTREAFEGTLTIFNGHTTDAMQEIKLNLEIKDENGVLCNDLFQIDTKALDILTGIDGSGTLASGQKGSATVLFIPEKGAAPEVPKSYSFGGSFSYLDPFTGVTVTKPLFPVTLDVNPSPDLYLHYFMQRDILGDDALTAPIEPIVPAEFAVMVQNNGFGTAQNVRIESAQPKIVENEKGLAINFALIGSNLNGLPRQLGLTNIDFGNISPQKAAIGQWWFTSDLLGHFVSYEAKVSHLDSRGNPDLSLISGATLHELIKSVRIYSGAEDGINDFLVNEVQDAKEFPDVIYLSNGGVLDVYPAVSSSITGSMASGNHELELQVAPKQAGWNYIKFSDPGNGTYRIASVIREDGQAIPLDNVWQTHVTLPDGKDPVYENMIHFLDVFATTATQKYTIRFTAKDQNPPEIVRFDNVPSAAVTSPLTSVNVVFNKPIDPATFTFEDMTLRIQGGADVMDNAVNVSQLDPVTYRIDLTSKSIQNGYYVLTVQAAEISNLSGTKGLTGKQATWTQFISIPAVSEFIGLPDNNIGAPIDFILLRFNLPIDRTTLLPATFNWMKDGRPVTGSIHIAGMDTEGRLFQLSGLNAFMSQDGNYSLTVDLPGIKSLEGNNGILQQSVAWEIDMKAPQVNKIISSDDGGYDAQHKTVFTVEFTEPVTGFGTGSLELWKDGLRQPLSQVNFARKNDSTYLFTEFRMLTWYEGNYLLRVKMKDITDLAGNTSTDSAKYEWTVKRTLPKAVTNLHITPDLGFSSTDDITATRVLVANMTVNEPGTRIQIYQTDQVNPILLADTMNVNAGPLSLPINLNYSGNLTLQAYCIDQYTNKAITEIPVFIDEAALVSSWKNTPQSVQNLQPDSLQIEFSDKLLDDSKLKEYLKFERDGQSLSVQNLTVTKTTDKIYVLKGMSQAGTASGTYSLNVDLTKLQKYNSGKQGIAGSKTQWNILKSNILPVANAGINQSVNEGTTVSLDGSASADSDGNTLTYAWTAPAAIELSSATAAKPTFTAPEVTADRDYTFTLVVNDGTVDSPADQVVITVKHVNKAPLANAGANQSVNEGETVMLDGIGSTDFDGNTLTYAWTTPAGITLSSATAVKPTFTAPEVTADTDYTFTLVVNDGTVNSPADQVVITVKHVNKVPQANAGVNQSVNEGSTVSLDGIGSTDFDGNPLTYAWTAPAGITLSSATAAKPTFTAPEVTADTDYTFTLVVNDGTVNSPADQVVITVKHVNKAPVANAGVNQSVNEGATVTLDGIGSTDFDENPLTYAWTAPAGITLSSANAVKPTFTAPEVIADTDYTFTLVVNDGTVNSPADQVVITVKHVNKAPVANAGVNQSVNEGATVSLDGIGSTDFDGNPLTYAWTTPAGIVLSSANAAKPTFTAPEVIADTDYTFTLVVNDGTVNSTADQVVITVKHVNKAPVANAGVNQSVNEGATVTLDGLGSTDFDENPLTYAWTAPAGIVLSSASAAKPTFTAPEVIADTDYTFTLMVNDGTVNSPADQVVVTVKHVNKAPQANAGANQSVNEGATVTLDGIGSTDFDGNPLTFAWTAPAGIVLSSATAAKPTFTAPEVTANTDYTFTLVVNDGTVNSPSDQVVVTVKHVNKAPAANAGVNQSVNEGSMVTLDGIGSNDFDGNTLTYAWTTPAGITLSSATAAKPTFTAPEVAADTDYTFTLVVNDGTVDSPADQVVITILQVFKAPVATLQQPSCSVSTGSITVTDPIGAGIAYSINGTDYTNTNGIFTLLPAGIYSITARNADGIISAGTTITINAQPPTPALPTASVTLQPTCTVSTGTITVTAPTGPGMTYSINGLTYTNTSGIFTSVPAGTYNITDRSTAGCTSNGTNVTVNVQPATPTPPLLGIITQPARTVTTGSVIFNGLPATGSWTLTTSPGGTVTPGSGISKTLTGLAAGTWSYTVTNASGCTSVSSPSVVIYAQPSAPAGLTATSCNDLVTLKWNQNTDPNFKRYRIYQGTTNNPTTQIDSTTGGISETEKIISGLTRGQMNYFRITAMNNGGAESNFGNESSVVVKTGVIPEIKAKWGDLLICYNLDNLISGYQWYKGSTLIPNATLQYFSTEKQSGSYSVMTTDLDGCKNSSTPVQVIAAGLKSLFVYPNPASVSFALKLTDTTGLKIGSDEKATVTLINQAGQVVMELQVKNLDDELLNTIPVNDLVNGVYIVQLLVNQEDVYYTKIVVFK